MPLVGYPLNPQILVRRNGTKKYRLPLIYNTTERVLMGSSVRLSMLTEIFIWFWSSRWVFKPKSHCGKRGEGTDSVRILPFLRCQIVVRKISKLFSGPRHWGTYEVYQGCHAIQWVSAGQLADCIERRHLYRPGDRTDPDSQHPQPADRHCFLLKLTLN